MLKLWEDERNTKLAWQKRILESLASYIFTRAVRSKETSVAVGKYLKDHAEADISYAIQLKSQLIYLPSSSSINTSSSLKSSLAMLSQIQSNLSNTFKNLAQGIEQIINTKLAANLMEYENEISEANSKCQTVLNELNFMFTKADKNFREYMNVCSSQDAQIAKQKSVTTCRWLCESRYIITILSLSNMLFSYTGLVKICWEMLKRLENSRVACVKDCLFSFLTLHNSVFRQSTEDVAMILQEMPSEIVEMNKILNTDDLEILRNEYSCEDPFDSFKNYILPQVPKKNLIVKEGFIERETGVFKVWKTSYAVLTIDKFLHVFNDNPYKDVETETIDEAIIIKKSPNSGREFHEPINSCYLSKANIIENEELYFEIIEAKQIGLLSKLSAPRRSVFKLNTLKDFLDWAFAIKQLALL
ncbi:hypothetical protein SteCoe_11965 [Stentor coeruleus]|uniref:PH domain-containing protein n=1 Tax=Stentor coeruleus TaxID=5963 RepID=A0A1R2CBW3_9CILI|nr:hypothetical protein SteCoe_11965 [Stentor coeruleus]